MGDILYYNKIEIENFKDSGEFIRLGKCIILNLKSKKIKFDKEEATIKEILIDGEFFYKLMIGELFTIEGIVKKANFSFEKDKINSFKEYIVFIKKIYNILNYYGVNDEINLSLVDGESEKNIHILDKVLTNHVKLDNMELSVSCSTFRICNLKIATLIKKKENNEYKISNFFCENKIEIRIAKEEENFKLENSSKSSIYTILTQDDLLSTSNINYNCIINDIKYINYLQTIVRSRELNNEEKNKLIELKNQNITNNVLCFMFYVLLLVYY